jgi:hypothetical protein
MSNKYIEKKTAVQDDDAVMQRRALLRGVENKEGVKATVVVIPVPAPVVSMNTVLDDKNELQIAPSGEGKSRNHKKENEDLIKAESSKKDVYTTLNIKKTSKDQLAEMTDYFKCSYNDIFKTMCDEGV